MYLHLLERFPQKITSILIETLFDTSTSLRELAIFYLKQNGIQPGQIYQRALNSGERPLHLSIMGLAETGYPEDFKLIEPYLKDCVLKVKSACLYAVFKLKPNNRQQLILAQLPTVDPIVAKTICSGLVKYFADYDIEVIEKKFCQGGNIQAEFSFMKVKLNTIKDCWNLIEYMVDSLLKYSDHLITLYLQRKLVKWIIANSPNKIFTRPSKIRLNLIITKAEELLAKNQQENLYRELKNHLLKFG